ncbi:unnamed protein product [Paramecium pentaurelia]|uniref:Uncharacterized protein n=1 Tax=Paramecium pentaurelia TaxID=43138 RepID=A0A8S1SQS9_9CILI|nr:unnamed protein product [Paramecium pentaurelia]
MSVQKYKKSGSCKSDSAYSFSQDVNLLQDYEYLLQKSAEELTKVKEQNQFLEQQLASVQPFHHNQQQYSTFQFNKSDLLIEQLKQENADLKLKLETKTKAHKKLKTKLKQHEQIMQENENLKRDIQDLLKEKINNKENRQNLINQSTKTPQQQQQQNVNQAPCNNFKLDLSLASNFNFKGLEEADKFLQETKIQSSRVSKMQTIPTPKRYQEIQTIEINFSDFDLQNNLSIQQEFVQFIEQVIFKANNQLNQRIQTSQIDNFIKSNQDLETQIIQLSEEVWILREKNKIQQEIIKQLKHNLECCDQKDIEELIKLNQQANDFIEIQQQEIKSLSELVIQTEQELLQKSQIILDNIQIIEKAIKKATIQDNIQDENKENQSCISNQKLQKKQTKSSNYSSLQSTQTLNKQSPQLSIDLQEYNEMKTNFQKVFQEVEQFQQLLNEFQEQEQNNNISNQDLFEILELFQEEFSYRENTSIKDQIKYYITQTLNQNELLKNKYLDLIYKVILNQIKTDTRRTELLVKNDQKLQDALKWLLQNTKRSQSVQTIIYNCDILTDMIVKKLNNSTRMSELHEIITMQMKVIYTLLQSLQIGKNNLQSSRTILVKNEKQETLMNEAIQDLKDLNKKISNLPDTNDDLESSDVKENIRQICNKFIMN